MGDLVLKGATSGQITVTPTAIAGTNTLTLPAKTGNIITSADSGTVTQAMLASGVAGSGPAFSAYTTTPLTVTNNVNTKARISTETFDTANCYDPTTNYRFTPNVAGYYQFNYLVFGKCATSTSLVVALIYKNGSGYYVIDGLNSAYMYGGGTVFTDGAAYGSALIYMNGSTDYVEVYGRIFGTGTPTIDGARFEGSLVRAA